MCFNLHDSPPNSTTPAFPSNQGCDKCSHSCLSIQKGSSALSTGVCHPKLMSDSLIIISAHAKNSENFLVPYSGSKLKLNKVRLCLPPCFCSSNKAKTLTAADLVSTCLHLSWVFVLVWLIWFSFSFFLFFFFETVHLCSSDHVQRTWFLCFWCASWVLCSHFAYRLFFFFFWVILVFENRSQS